MTHAKVNIVILEASYNFNNYFFETSAAPDKIYLSDFNNETFKKRFLNSRGLSHCKTNLSKVTIKGFKIKEDEKE